MTRKDFQLIAEVIYMIADDGTRKAIAEAAYWKLRYTNPRFDKEKFYKACGVSE